MNARAGNRSAFPAPMARQHITELRKHRKLSQSALAKADDISRHREKLKKS